MNFLIVDFEFTMHKRYGRPRVWFPEIIEVGAVVADGYGVLQDKVYNAFVKDTWLVGWGNQDRLVLKNGCDKYGFEYPFLFENYIDLATEYMIFNNRDRMISLKDAIKETGVEKKGILHAAYDDSVNAALVMQKVIYQGWTNDRTQLSVAM